VHHKPNKANWTGKDPMTKMIVMFVGTQIDESGAM